MKHHPVVTCYLQHGEKGDDIARNFAIGCGGVVKDNKTFVEEGSIPEGPIFCWGILRGNDLIARYCFDHSHEIFYADNCYFGRKEFFRITRNASQNTQYRDRPDDRFRENSIDIKPWRKSGSHILVCPPTPGVELFFKAEAWLQNTLETLKKVTDRPITIRRKPVETKIGFENGYMVNAGNIYNDVSRSLEEDLIDCWAVVAFQSSVVNDAIASGIPAFVDDMNSARILENTSIEMIESPQYGDQEAYFRHLSYCQFTKEEMKSGKAWEILNS